MNTVEVNKEFPFFHQATIKAALRFRLQDGLAPKQSQELSQAIQILNEWTVTRLRLNSGAMFQDEIILQYTNTVDELVKFAAMGANVLEKLYPMLTNQRVGCAPRASDRMCAQPYPLPTNHK